ncbi:hypothetical protein EON83_23040 [bacterium]|nr:MAG: hypothetical protein EON83_23040 [bacterium]
MLSFNIKTGSKGDYLTIHVLDTPKSAGARYDDWVDVGVEIKAGGFIARYKAQFFVNEILILQADLERLYNNLSGSLKFQTLEGQLEFEITGNGRGNFETQGEAWDKSGGQSRLCFSFETFDQTYIPQMLKELAEIKSQLIWKP